MACGPSLLEVLDEDDWTFEDIKKLLEHNPSSVHEFSNLRETPLHRVLVDSECSLNVVKLLLYYGADVNCSNCERATPLTLACSNDRVDIIRLLLKRGANVNLVGMRGKSPLCHSLSNYTTGDTIRLLLDSGSSLESCKYHKGFVMLCATDRNALEHKHISVLQTLIEKGANMNAVDIRGRSPLCHALGSGSELCVIKMLLTEGGLLDACMRHFSPLQCATSTESSSFFAGCVTLKSDVIKMLLEFIKVHESELLSDSTPLQDAISYFPCEEKVIELLLDHLQLDEDFSDDDVLEDNALNGNAVNGNALNDNALNGNVLNANVLNHNVLNDNVLDVDVSDFVFSDDDVSEDNSHGHVLDDDVLNGDVFDGDFFDGSENLFLMNNFNTLLHVAVLNHNCIPSTVKLLIKRGYPVDWVNNDGDTALHVAVSHKYASTSVIEALLENGATANAVNLSGENPLHIAVKQNIENVDVFKTLFIAGARIGVTGYFLLKKFVDRCKYQHINWYDFEDEQTDSYDFEDEQSDSSDFEDEYYIARKRFDCCKMLFKCCFLENPNFQIDRLIHGHLFLKEMSRFGSICVHEVRKMDSMTVGRGYTLREFLVEDSSHRVAAAKGKKYNFNRLLEIINKNSFPVYFDIITAKVGMPAMKQKIQEVEVYYQRCFSGQTQRVGLDYKTVCDIAKYLTDEDLLRFISAFHKMDPRIFSYPIIELLKINGRDEQSEQFNK